MTKETLEKASKIGFRIEKLEKVLNLISTDNPIIHSDIENNISSCDYSHIKKTIKEKITSSLENAQKETVALV